MADKLGLGTEVRELKLGTSFTNPRNLGYHTLRYDFKPASVDMNQMGTVDVGSNGQVTVTVPPNTVFKGSAKPYQKQCVLVINMDTKEITLERLSSNIQVKKTRSEKPPSAMPPAIPTLEHMVNHKGRKPGQANSRGPKVAPVKPAAKSKSQHLAASLSSVVPKHSPLHASPNRKSPNSTTRLSPNGPTINNANSLSMIELEDNFMDSMFPGPEPVKERVHTQNSKKPLPPIPQVAERPRGMRPMPEPPRVVVEQPPPPPPPGPPPPPLQVLHEFEGDVGVLSDSSSSSSSSSSDSSDSSDSEEAAPLPIPARPSAATAGPRGASSSQMLRQDLQLSSEGSDYD